MDRRTYIYIVTPLVVFLNCGELLVSRLGATLALVVAGVAMVVVWRDCADRNYGLSLR